MQYDAQSPEYYMSLALRLAQMAYERGEVPVGAVVVRGTQIMGTGFNQRETGQCATLHAELTAIENACRAVGNWRLSDCDLYVTLEPCPMCAGAIINARVRHVYIGALDAKAGAVRSVASLFEMPFNHRPLVTCGILEQECGQILSDFFSDLRTKRG
ncbi:MAG: nucleoside deaminase [Acetanaerobacterium sp.]